MDLEEIGSTGMGETTLKVLHGLYSSPNIFRVFDLRIMRHGLRLKDNVKRDLQEIEWEA